MKLKITISFLLILCILFSFCSCKKKTPDDVQKETVTIEEESSEINIYKDVLFYSVNLDKNQTPEKIIITCTKNNTTLWTYSEDNTSNNPYESVNLLSQNNNGIHVWLNNKIIFLNSSGKLQWSVKSETFPKNAIADNSYLYCISTEENPVVSKYDTKTGTFIGNYPIVNIEYLQSPIQLKPMANGNILITDAYKNNIELSVTDFSATYAETEPILLNFYYTHTDSILQTSSDKKDDEVTASYQYKNFQIATFAKKGISSPFLPEQEELLKEIGTTKISNFDFKHSQATNEIEGITFIVDAYVLTKDGCTYMICLQYPKNTDMATPDEILSHFTLK